MNRLNYIANRIIILVVLLQTNIGCNLDEGQDEAIDFQRLPALKVDMVDEFTGNDAYLPAKLRDLVIISDSIMLVSDVGTNTIEQFTTEGKHVATIAKAGRGPGELSNLFIMYRGAGDTLYVRNRIQIDRIDSFSKGLSGVYQHRHSWAPDEADDRFISMLGRRRASTYYSTAVVNSRDIQQNRMNFKRGFKHTPVAVVNQYEKVLKDSLYLLKSPNTLADFGPASMRIIGMPPYQAADRFRVLEEGSYVIARPDSSILCFYNANHELQHRVSLDIAERPVTEEDLEFLLDSKQVEGDDREKMEARVPEIKPPFLNVWITENRIWLHTNTNEKGNEIVVLTRTGEPLGKIELAFEDEISTVKEKRIYTLHKNPNIGHSVRIYAVEL